MKATESNLNGTLPKLAHHHAAKLFHGSGVDTILAGRRGYRTAYHRSELEGFKDYQRRVPALVVPTFSPDGVTSGTQIRPDYPRVSRDTGKAIKYESPGGSRAILDTHPINLPKLKDPTIDLFVTEGPIKGDSITSAGEAAGLPVAAVSVAGVWNFQKDGELLPCWDNIAIEGRRVYIVYDSDVMVKGGVAKALERAVRLLSERRANVFVVYLPDAPDGSRLGVDDYLVAGGTLADLKAAARRFSWSDFTHVRRSRNDRLRLAVAELWRRWERIPVRKRSDATMRSVVRCVIQECEQTGRVREEDGAVEVTIDSRTVADRCAVSRWTAMRALKKMCEGPGVSLSDKPRRREAAQTYVLYPPRAGRAEMHHQHHNPCKSEDLRGRAVLHHEGEGGPEKDGSTSNNETLLSDSPPSGAGARALVPELRWSGPVMYAERDDRTGRRIEKREYLARLGKDRAALLEYLLDVGGSASVSELMGEFAGAKARPRDFKRRRLAPLTDPAIVEIKGDMVHVTHDWRDRLEDARKLGREDEAAEAQRDSHRRAREAFRNRDRLPPAEEVPPIERVLSPEDADTLEAIRRYEGAHGRGSFTFDRAGAKKLFYSREGKGHFPDDDQLIRLRAYLKRAHAKSG